MSIFEKKKPKTEVKQEKYTKSMLLPQLQKEAQVDFNNQIRRFKENGGYTRHLTADLIELLRQQAIQFKIEEQDMYRL